MDKAGNLSIANYKRYDFSIPTCTATQSVINSILGGVLRVTKIFEVR